MWRPANVEGVETLGAATAVRPMPGADSESEIIIASSFADAQQLADHLRVRRPVVLDLRETEPDTVRRLVDFASGITYALDGTMQKIAQGVILVFIPDAQATRNGAASPTANPMAVPSAESTEVSTRNCVIMSDCLAPSARRIPISIVRSLTVASMIFMIPIPPTKSEMAAVDPRTKLKIR